MNMNAQSPLAAFNSWWDSLSFDEKSKCMLGMWLKPEHVPDSVIRELRREPAVQNGKRSGEARRARRKWVAHATELATALRKEDPSLSQDKVAAEITLRWKEKDIDSPGQKTLKDHIATLEKIGALPKRI